MNGIQIQFPLGLPIFSFFRAHDPFDPTAFHLKTQVSCGTFQYVNLYLGLKKIYSIQNGPSRLHCLTFGNYQFKKEKWHFLRDLDLNLEFSV